MNSQWSSAYSSTIYATGISPAAPRPIAGSLMLQKPFHPQEIVQAVGKATARQQA
jgi:hypothetical protein